jgi:hypothetical protein
MKDDHLGCPQQGVPSMCDYSLHLVASRPAKVGDKLVTTKFNNSLTRGFAAVGEPHVAVCLLPGTEVAFEKEVECEHFFRVFRSRKLIVDKVARFRQIKTEDPNAHHDALEFPDGQIVLLTRLSEGQHATVLQLPAQPKSPAEVEARARVAQVA